jgi:predicted nucleic acid-binding protein
MIVVSNTTPLRYLIEIDEVHILEKLFGRVIISEKVREELQGKKTPQIVKLWIQSPPSWLEVRHANPSLFTPEKRIQEGERQAIALTIELKPNALLIDDADAMKEAARLSLPFMRTLRVMEEASKQGFLDDLPEAIEKLRQTTFHMPSDEFIIEPMLERDRKRKLAMRHQTRPRSNRGAGKSRRKNKRSSSQPQACTV